MRVLNSFFVSSLHSKIFSSLLKFHSNKLTSKILSKMRTIYGVKSQFLTKATMIWSIKMKALFTSQRVQEIIVIIEAKDENNLSQFQRNGFRNTRK